MNNLNDMTKKELLELARKKKIKAWMMWPKATIIEAIETGVSPSSAKPKSQGKKKPEHKPKNKTVTIYADNEKGDNQSFVAGSRYFFAEVGYIGSKPKLPQEGITFTKFIPAVITPSKDKMANSKSVEFNEKGDPIVFKNCTFDGVSVQHASLNPVKIKKQFEDLKNRTEFLIWALGALYAAVVIGWFV